MSVTTLTYSPAYNGGANFTWCLVTFSSSDGGLTYTGSPTQLNDSIIPGNTSLTNAIIGDIVTLIGTNTFYNSQLSSINIPNSVITISSYSFYLCTLLSSISIPNSVTSIGEGAFQNCSSLPSISIPNSVTSIDALVFSDCSSLSSISIPNSVTSIGLKAFFNCSLLSSVTIGNSVTSIGQEAFSNCSSLPSIIIPNSVTSIGQQAFFVCSQLSSVIIGNSVTSIDQQAFSNCTSLPSISIPNSVTRIGFEAFFNCNALETVFITDATAKVLNPAWSSPTANPPGITDFYGAPPVAFVSDFGPITITNISPNSGTNAGGTTVTITGTNFTATTLVTFGGNSASSVNVVSDTTITCVTPAGTPGQVDVVVSNEDGRATFVSGFTYFSICFKEGSKILTDKGYIVVQDLRNGDLVKTLSSGFKDIQHIGYSKMYHNVNEVRSKDKLYRCPISEYPELTEDLVITGCHSILVKSFKNDLEREKTIEVNGNTYVTDRHYRLPACADCRTKIFEEEGVHTIWHFSLENPDYYMNYGVYANGLLVETTSNRMMLDLSGMTLHF